MKFWKKWRSRKERIEVTFSEEGYYVIKVPGLLISRVTHRIQPDNAEAFVNDSIKGRDSNKPPAGMTLTVHEWVDLNQMIIDILRISPEGEVE